MVEKHDEALIIPDPSEIVGYGVLVRQQPFKTKSLIGFVKMNPINILCFFLHILTIAFASQHYYLSLIGFEYIKAVYYRAFVAGIATNSIKLYHRIKSINFPGMSVEFMQTAKEEDSFHYIFYCMIFCLFKPMYITLIPIMLFSFFHIISFLATLANEIGLNSNFIVKKFISFKINETENILKLIAWIEILIFFIEIFNFPNRILLIYNLNWKRFILFPLFYIGFLKLRYASPRNHHFRFTIATINEFHQRVIERAQCPSVIKTFVPKKLIRLESSAPSAYSTIFGSQTEF